MARAGPSSAPKAPTKPYDRPSAYQLKIRGKPKADLPSSSSAGADPSSLPSKSAGGNGIVLDTGAPAALGQTSRKGKKAWRKNIDLRDVEGALEEAREEERVTGGKVADRSNGSLFTVDVTGDAALASNLRKSRPKKPLRSLAILAERSAIPSLSPRYTIAPSAPKVRPQEKARLRRIALREHRPEGQSASQIPIAPTLAGSDAWASDPTLSLPGGFGEEAIAPPKPKFPVTLARRREGLHGAIVEGRNGEVPDSGTSYNPTVESHRALIEKALEEERGKLAQEAEDLERINERGMVIENRKAVGRTGEYAEGMDIGPGEVEGGAESEEEIVDEDEEKRKQKGRKTQAQRNKAIRLREAAEAEKRAKMASKLAKSIGALGAFKKAEQEREARHAQAAKIKKEMKMEKEAKGTKEAGDKVGKYVLRKGDVAVQLGEDLAETLRQVKPEGNHFKDQFLAMQRKGLVEPRLPQARKQKAARTKEYEKHAYKRFV